MFGIPDSMRNLIKYKSIDDSIQITFDIKTILSIRKGITFYGYCFERQLELSFDMSFECHKYVKSIAYIVCQCL